VAISAGVQRMVRSDLGASGVAFTLDTESGFDQVVLISASYGLGETVVQGAVNPDEFCVYKPALAAGRPAILHRRLGEKRVKRVYADESDPAAATRVVEMPEADRRRFALGDADIEELARLAVCIERHYGRAMDIEWAKDGQDGRLYIVQARPETVRSRADRQVVERYRLRSHGAPIATGHSVGHKIGAGMAHVLRHVQDGARLKEGDVLVADMTDPDWGPVMRRAAAIVTNRGGRACHAAIVARELGIPAVVGCGNATERIRDGAEVTVSCAEGATGHVYAGRAEFEVSTLRVNEMPQPPVRIMMNLGNPDQAFQLSMLPSAGVGLARIEFIINRMIGIHPKAALRFAELPPDLQKEIRERMAGYDNPFEYYVGRLAEGIAMLAAAFAPRPVIVRTSDFKSNEYANLLGGKLFEPAEENPMLGLRGAARYIADTFREGFELECRALKRVRDDMGLTNVEIMIPFLRTVEEAQAVTELLATNGLRRGENGLRLIMMCEVPSNALLANKFLDFFDGFSIGSNDLTQLTLGVDRDSAELAGVFDERDPAVRALMRRAIRACRKRGLYVGICGQGPSDYPDFARWLVKQGIDSISLNPDVLVETWLYLAGQGARPPVG
jgi:pyruvate,water dikinase